MFVFISTSHRSLLVPPGLLAHRACSILPPSTGGLVAARREDVKYSYKMLGPEVEESLQIEKIICACS
jgi:hypothetical protein